MNGYERAISARINRYERIKIIDFLRGFCVLLMIFDHTMYDLKYVAPYLWGYTAFSIRVSSLASQYWSSGLRAYGWICAVGCFVFLCGMSTGLSRNNLLRGIRLTLVAYLITAVTRAGEIILNMRGIAINFGVLHTLSFCIMCYALCAEGAKGFTLFMTHRRTYNLSDVFVLILFACSVYATISYGINPSYYPPNYKFISISDMELSDFIAYGLGIDKTLPSSDYIPVLPWLFVFFTGAFSAGFLKRKRRFTEEKHTPDIISNIGSHSLIVYIVHQPVLYAVMYIVGVILTGKIILI